MSGRWSTTLLMLAFSALVGFGCASGSQSHAGDSSIAERGEEAMDQGDYARAADQFRRAHDRNPQNSGLKGRIDDAEERLLNETLRTMDGLESQGEPQRGISEAADAARWIEDFQRLDTLQQRSAELIEDNVDDLRDDGDHQAAEAMIQTHSRAFDNPDPDIHQTHRDIGDDRVDELRELAQYHRSEGRWGAAALFFAQADDLAGIDPADVSAMEAVERVKEQDAWGLDISGNLGDDRLQQILDGVHGAPMPDDDSILDPRLYEDYALPVELRVEEVNSMLRRDTETEERTARFRDGSRTVPNPVYERRREAMNNLEDQIRALENSIDDARMDLEEAEYRLQQRRDEGASTTRAQQRVNRAERRLRQRQQVLDHRQYHHDRIQSSITRMSPTLRRPETSEYTYEVHKQHAELTAVLDVAVVVGPRDFEESKTLEVTAEEMTISYDSDPDIDLGEDDTPPPAEESLEVELDEKMLGEIRRFVRDVYRDHRTEVVGNTALLTEDEEIDALARFIATNPDDRQPAPEDRLNELVGFDAGGLLVRVARDQERLD